jgi:hypothetical protein
MSLVRATRPRATGIGARSVLPKGTAGLLILGAVLGCHVFSPGLSPRDASGTGSPDTTLPIPESPPGEDVSPTGTPEPLTGPAVLVGCSDGTREGFRDLTLWPAIAGCAGGWQKMGLPTSALSTKPCSGEAGNNSLNPNGLRCLSSGPCTECSVTDLCARGWRPCLNGNEVMARSPTGCENILPPGERGLFIAMEGASAEGVCAPRSGQHNDLHGCGNLGSPESGQCPPFIRRLGFADCENTGGVWQCGSSAQRVGETEVVTKPSSDLGGVLCCKED